MRKYSYERLDGSIRAEERFAAIRSFSSSSANMGLNSEADQNEAFVFIISTRAGGVGLKFDDDEHVVVDDDEELLVLAAVHALLHMNLMLALLLLLLKIKIKKIQIYENLR